MNVISQWLNFILFMGGVIIILICWFGFLKTIEKKLELEEDSNE